MDAAKLLTPLPFDTQVIRTTVSAEKLPMSFSLSVLICKGGSKTR